MLFDAPPKKEQRHLATSLTSTKVIDDHDRPYKFWNYGHNSHPLAVDIFLLKNTFYRGKSSKQGSNIPHSEFWVISFHNFSASKNSQLGHYRPLTWLAEQNPDCFCLLQSVLIDSNLLGVKRSERCCVWSGGDFYGSFFEVHCTHSSWPNDLKGEI